MVAKMQLRKARGAGGFNGRAEGCHSRFVGHREVEDAGQHPAFPVRAGRERYRRPTASGWRPWTKWPLSASCAGQTLEVVGQALIRTVQRRHPVSPGARLVDEGYSSSVQFPLPGRGDAGVDGVALQRMTDDDLTAYVLLPHDPPGQPRPLARRLRWVRLRPAASPDERPRASGH